MLLASLSAPQVHDRFPAREWPHRLCPELRDALTAMRHAEALGVTALTLETAGETAVVACTLDRAPGKAAMRAARTAKLYYRHLTLAHDHIGCPHHGARVGWAAPVNSQVSRRAPFTARLRHALGFDATAA